MYRLQQENIKHIPPLFRWKFTNLHIRSCDSDSCWNCLFSVGLVVVVSPLTGRDEALTSILGAAFRHGAVQALNERTNERIPSRPTD